MSSLREAFAEELVNLGRTNNHIVVLDCDMSKHTRMDLFSKYYDDRFYQMGISEQNCIGVAAGLAKGGRVPIVSSFAIFICGRAWEQIRHSIAYNDTNVKIFATHSGLSAGEDGGSHQCIEDIALMMSIPKIEVFAPAFPYECKAICRYIIKSSKPAYIRVGRSEVQYDLRAECKIGDPIIVGNCEAEIAVISTGEITQEAYDLLMNYPFFKLLHIGSLRPMNIEKVNNSLNDVKRVIIIEEHVKYGGLASILYMNGVLNSKEVICLNMGEQFGQTGTEEELRSFYGLSKKHIEFLIKEHMNK